MSVVVTQPLVLSCNATDNWKVCSWHIIDGPHCLYRYTYDPDSVGYQWENNEEICDSHFNSPKFTGSDGYKFGKQNQLCQIKIESAEFKHEGEYECWIQKCNEEKDGGCKATEKDMFPSKAKILVKVNLVSEKIL